MNLKNVIKLRDFIRALPPQACDMDTWLYVPVPGTTYATMKRRGFSCGSAGCLGGWTELIANRRVHNERFEQPKISAADYLGLDGGEMHMLFYEYSDDPPRGWKTWMIRRLNGILRDGEVLPWEDQMKPKRVAKKKKAG